MKEREHGFLITPRLPIESKLLLASSAIVVGIIVFMVFFYNSYSQGLERERQYMTKNLSSAAVGVAQYFYDLSLTAEMTTKQAQTLAMNTLKRSTYGKNGYFWINDGKGKMIMHPYRADMVGQVLLDMKDINGKLFFKQFIDVSKKGGGWVAYYWPKPHTDEEYPKISYVSYFEPWDWIVGTGDYIDDMEENIFKTFAQAAGLLFVIFLALIVGTVVISNHYIKQLGNLALRDPLTNLYTKRFLYLMLPRILDKSRRLKNKLLTVIFFDIDHFKKVNDTCGHNIGDVVLRKVAGVLSKNTRPDDYCIRYGGEEFVLLGFYDDKASTVKIAERIRSECAGLLFDSNYGKFGITISAGIAFYHETKETFNETVMRADAKLYKSKKAGRDRITI
ncbi:MAG: diguanylate cyclase [Candidatus Thiodiazotropha sp.]